MIEPERGTAVLELSVAAIVPAFRAASCIERCIAALTMAGFTPSEIIVVDDGSTDGTGDAAAAAGVRVLRHARCRGAAAARNTGAEATDADILLFVDADVLVHPDAKRVVLAFLSGHPDHAGLFGAYDEAPECPSAVSKARNLLHRYVHIRNAGDVASFWTGCGAVRREAWTLVGGFDVDIRMMEDVVFGIELAAAGHRIRLVPDLEGTHLKCWTLRSIFRTDLFDRAVPWARIMRERSATLPDRLLNIDRTARVSVLSVATVLAGAVALPVSGPLGIALALAGIGGLVSANRGFLSFYARIVGRRSVPAAAAVLFVHYLCGGLGFAWVWSGLDGLAPRGPGPGRP